MPAVLTLVDAKRELASAAMDVENKTSVSNSLRAVEEALARQVTTKKLNIAQLSVTNEALALLEKAIDELQSTRVEANEGAEALERVMQTLRQAVMRVENTTFNETTVGRDGSLSTAQKAEMMVLMVKKLADERDRAIEAKVSSGTSSGPEVTCPRSFSQCLQKQEDTHTVATVSERSKHTLSGNEITAAVGQSLENGVLSDAQQIPPTGCIPTVSVPGSDDVKNNCTSADLANTASPPPPSNPVTTTELSNVAPLAESAVPNKSPFSSAPRVLDLLAGTPLSAGRELPYPDRIESMVTDDMADVLTSFESVVRVMAKGDANGCVDGKANARLQDVLNLVARLDMARRSAEDAAVAARSDVAAMRAEVAVAWEALATPQATPSQSTVERFAEELEALLREKDAVTAAAAQELKSKRRAIFASAEAQRQLVLESGARARAESALRSAHEQVEGLKRHARELADLNQTSRQQVAVERSRSRQLKDETRNARDHEEKERRRADSLQAEVIRLRTGLTARTRESLRNANFLKEARSEVERERRLCELLREREKQLEREVCELENANAQQAKIVSRAPESKLKEMEILVQELAREEIRARSRASKAEEEAIAAKKITSDALSEIAVLREEIALLSGLREGSASVT